MEHGHVYNPGGGGVVGGYGLIFFARLLPIILTPRSYAVLRDRMTSETLRSLRHN